MVSLKEAREKAFANRKLARDGSDPRAEKRRSESMPTFADASRTVCNQLRPGWRSPLHARLWLATLEHHVFPHIGKMPIAEVTSKEILEKARALEYGAARLIFPREGGKPLGSGRLRKLLRWNGITGVPHGFRSSFRDWAAEETDHPCEVVEPASGRSIVTAEKGVSWRYGSVNGTCRVDSQKAVPVIHKDAFPNRSAFHAVTAPLKRPFMVQPAVEDRSVQVVIGGERTGRSQRLMEADFNR